MIFPYRIGLVRILLCLMIFLAIFEIESRACTNVVDGKVWYMAVPSEERGYVYPENKVYVERLRIQARTTAEKLCELKKCGALMDFKTTLIDHEATSVALIPNESGDGLDK